MKNFIITILFFSACAVLATPSPVENSSPRTGNQHTVYEARLPGVWLSSGATVVQHGVFRTNQTILAFGDDGTGVFVNQRSVTSFQWKLLDEVALENTWPSRTAFRICAVVLSDSIRLDGEVHFIDDTEYIWISFGAPNCDVQGTFEKTSYGTSRFLDLFVAEAGRNRPQDMGKGEWQ